jgi:anaerobic selenocysteine-containing dehydrogenase
VPEFVTACPRNCYSTCTMRVRVEGGRLTRIEPVPDNRATAEGLCLKGLAYAERVISPDRILHPLRRLAGGGFARIAWDEALDEIAARLRRYREESGPQSVLHYAASGSKGLLNSVGPAFWRLFGGCTTTYGDLCWPAGLEATRLMLGAAKHNAPWDLASARLIILWGKNAAETNVHQIAFVEKAIALGAKLVVIDPRRTETAERAQLWIQPRPGTDGALALALGACLLREDRIDRAFIDAHVQGFDDYAARVSGWTPERAAAICDIQQGRSISSPRGWGRSAPPRSPPATACSATPTAGNQ